MLHSMSSKLHIVKSQDFHPYLRKVSGDGGPTMTIGGKFMPQQYAVYVMFITCKVAHQKDTAPRIEGGGGRRGAVDVKSVVADRAQMCTTDHGIPWYSYRMLPLRKKTYLGLPRRK
jgi:hypothetical protein